MANIAISALPVAASQAGADVLPIVQATTSTTKQLSVTNLFTSPTFVTPALGTVASGVISACTSTVHGSTAPVLGNVASGNISAKLHQHLDGIDHTCDRCGNRHQPYCDRHDCIYRHCGCGLRNGCWWGGNPNNQPHHGRDVGTKPLAQ
jgi:hypothetical protein